MARHVQINRSHRRKQNIPDCGRLYTPSCGKRCGNTFRTVPAQIPVRELSPLNRTRNTKLLQQEKVFARRSVLFRQMVCTYLGPLHRSCDSCLPYVEILPQIGLPKSDMLFAQFDGLVIRNIILRLLSYLLLLNRQRQTGNKQAKEHACDEDGAHFGLLAPFFAQYCEFPLPSVYKNFFGKKESDSESDSRQVE